MAEPGTVYVFVKPAKIREGLDERVYEPGTKMIFEGYSGNAMQFDIPGYEEFEMVEQLLDLAIERGLLRKTREVDELAKRTAWRGQSPAVSRKSAWEWLKEDVE
jgi:hypothetical protein